MKTLGLLVIGLALSLLAYDVQARCGRGGGSGRPGLFGRSSGGCSGSSGGCSGSSEGYSTYQWNMYVPMSGGSCNGSEQYQQQQYQPQQYQPQQQQSVPQPLPHGG